MTYGQYFEKAILGIQYRSGILEGKSRIKRELVELLSKISREYCTEESREILRFLLDRLKSDWLVVQIEVENLKNDIKLLENFKDNMLKNKLTYKEYKNETN